MSLDLANRIRNVTAVLGPTNTGKTHLAIERMLGHESGLIGLPLRLLAREVYDKIAARVGADRVALVTGEEKIKPERARYIVCTVEAMPRDADVEFLAIDEVQLAADPERGHVFTDRLLHVRGKSETLLLGAHTMRDAIADLIPGANFISRPRLSKLTYAGEKKITRLPGRTAVVAFSASEVYAIAELIRRQRGGAAVVLGALSPRTRNAQVALYQSGDVDFLVATDAIGMGLNLDVDHVAFAGSRKFDGQVHRLLTPGELAQIAGRAGRHMNDGTFGVTGTVEPFSADVIERLETHNFESVKSLQWRNRELDFASLDRLRDSLRETPREVRLQRARAADDVTALEYVSRDPEVVHYAVAPAAVGRLWDVCQIPDYRKISTQNHAELVATLYKFLMSDTERIPEDWFAKQVAFADRTDGDIDTLANRIAHIRTWTFVSNRLDWLADPAHWQERTRAIEDALSDALHEQLTQRFVDRRTSALMRGLKDKDQLNAEIADDGAVKVADHYVGRLKGFRFYPDTEAEGIHGKATRNAAAHVLTKELALRVRRVVSAKGDAFTLGRGGAVMWRGDQIAQLEPGEDPLKPIVALFTDEHLPAADKERVQERLNTWITELVGERLKPLVEIANAQDIAGLARGIAFRLTENFGVLRRESIADELRSLDQPARAQLRKYGVRFGAFNIYFPMLVKPSCTDVAATLWMLKHGPAHGLDMAAMPEMPRPGLTSLPVSATVPEAFYRVAGFHTCGPRAVRIDMLERLADLIRPMLAWRPDPARTATPPKGATGDGGFRAMPEMMSILGCSADELGNVLKALGFWAERRPVPPVVAPVPDAAAEAAPGEAGEPAAAVAAADAGEPAAAPLEGAPAVAAADAAPAVTDVPAPAPTDGTGAPAAVAAVETDGAAAASAEPKFEEIWRPRRRGRAFEGAERQRRPHRMRRKDATHGARTGNADGPPGAGAEQVAEGAADAPKDRPPKDRGRDKPRGWVAGQHRAAGRDDRDKVAAERTGYRSGQKPGRDADQKPGKGGGFKRRDGAKPREDRPRFHAQASPATTKGAVDPDSPFAALSSLKAALEKRSQE